MSDTALRDLARRIESLEAEIAERNADKSEVYKEAKASGFDVKVLRQVLAFRRQREKLGSAALEEADTLFGLYLESIEGTPSRVRAHEGRRNPPSPSNRDVSAGGEASSGAAPQGEAPPAGIGSETLAGHEGRSEGAAVTPVAVAPPFQRRPYVLRPHCQRPECCAASGPHHCFTCSKAMEAHAA
jgi:uncharacterized protein (UPF0335 family)